MPVSAAADELQLEARPAAVPLARRWLCDRLPGWTSEGIESAQLVLSELVTNAVLHGTGPVNVVVSLRPDHEAVLEVTDRNPRPPVLNHYATGASTGRGLLLVDGIAKGWGVRRFPGGKAIWAVVVDEPLARRPTPREATGSERGETAPEWSPPSDVLREAPPKAAGDALELVPVRIVGLPLSVYDEAREHNDGLMRELRWLTERGPGGDVPERLVALALEVSETFGPESESLRARVSEARERGQVTVDLEMKLSRRGWEALVSLARLFDHADEFCNRGELLTLASSPSIRRFRSWYLGEVISQLAGREPRPWPGDTAPGTAS